MNKKLLYIVFVILVFGSGASYLIAGKLAEKEIRSNVDYYISNHVPDYLNDYYEVSYDAGITGFFVPTISNLEINIKDNGLPKNTLVLKVDSVMLHSYSANDYEVSLNNFHLDYTKASLQQYLIQNSGFSMSETELISNLDYIRGIDLLMSGKCTNLQCNAESILNVESLFNLEQNFRINGSEDLIAFYLENILKPMDPEYFEENPFIIFEALGLLAEIKELSYSFDYKDRGLFKNTDLKKIIENNLSIDNFEINQASLGFDFNDKDINLDSTLDTSYFKTSGSIQYEFNSYMLMTEPDQSFKLANAKINIVNRGIDDLLWSIDPNINKNEILIEVDSIIDDLNQGDIFKKEFTNSSEGQIISNITGEGDPLKSMIMIRNFIENPESINIEYTPKRPIGLMEVQEMMDSPDWPTGMNITIQ
jgi:hypothetical protein